MVHLVLFSPAGDAELSTPRSLAPPMREHSPEMFPQVTLAFNETSKNFINVKEENDDAPKQL